MTTENEVPDIFELTEQLEAANERIRKLEKLLLATQHDLAIWINDFRAWPGAWCCERARGTNGWHHEGSCKNFGDVD